MGEASPVRCARRAVLCLRHAATRLGADLPIDNNWVEKRIRPIALGRQNWLFAGSLRAGNRAAAVMSLIYSAKLNRLDPYAYLRDVLERLPTHPASRVDELLPHRWTVPTISSAPCGTGSK